MHLLLATQVSFHPILAAQHPFLAERYAPSLDYGQRPGCTSPPVCHGHNRPWLQTRSPLSTVLPRLGRPNNPLHPHRTIQPQISS